jgi:hypothetical protein
VREIGLSNETPYGVMAFTQLAAEHGLPRIVRMASLFVAPTVEPYLGRQHAAHLVDVMARLVISYFLAPSEHVDLGDPVSARRFIATHVLPTFPIITSTGALS